MVNHRRAAAVATVAAAALLAACSPSGRGTGAGPGHACPPGCTQCDTATGRCRDCAPETNVCRGDSVVYCTANGLFGDTVKTCDGASGERCAAGNCLSACEVAAGSRSYIGCDYWPVTTMNSVLNPAFEFAVAVANPLTIGDVVSSAPATVKVERGGKAVVTRTVKAGAVEVIRLPWVRELSQNEETPRSVLLPDGAYHLVSSLPVTVYQFNPLEYEKPQSKDCMDVVSLDGFCHSYSNDATLLLPTNVLQADYLVASRQTFAITGQGTTEALPGFFAVVATRDATDVTVTYTAYTEPGSGLPAHAPGDKVTYHLDQGAVLEIASKRASAPCAATSSDSSGSYCDMGRSYDLTGTRVTSTRPVAVIGGHSCSFVPFDKWACDHLETQLAPVATWGQRVIGVSTFPQVAGEPNVWRVMSGTDGNAIAFDPPSVHAAVTLGAGQWIELVAAGGFQVSATGRIALAQYMVGANYSSDSGDTLGDPSLGMAPPVEQYRKAYDFLAPSTYQHSYLDVVAPAGAGVLLDGQPVKGTATPIGATGYVYRRAEIPEGAHHIESTDKFGISVSGVASYTSYLYAGGLNLDDVPLQ